MTELENLLEELTKPLTFGDRTHSVGEAIRALLERAIAEDKARFVTQGAFKRRLEQSHGLDLRGQAHLDKSSPLPGTIDCIEAERARIVSLLSEIEDLKQANTDLKDAQDCLSRESGRQKADLDRKTSEIAGLKYLQAEPKGLQAAVEGLTESLTKSTTKVLALKGEIERINQTRDREVEAYAKEVLNLQGHVRILKEKLSYAENKATALESETYVRNLDQALAKVQDLEATNKNLHERIAALVSERDQAQIRTEGQTDLIQDLETRLELQTKWGKGLSETLGRKVAQLEQAEAEIESLKPTKKVQKTRYAIQSDHCGDPNDNFRVYLTTEQYNHQMRQVNSTWVCPHGHQAHWDDDWHESIEAQNLCYGVDE